ncbi:MAG TPA: arylsulfatase [Pirellulales bacterium]|nr:arylsulfatase [Pirellulales bacterium]
MLVWLALAGAAGPRLEAAERDPRRPNVVVILADDIGYGDLGCYGATQVRTPNLDRLASQGRRFSDAHSPASVCTPTRAALLTGRYSWRQAAGSGILSGEAPLCISTSLLTLPKIFKSAGYVSGAVGKWHLGLGGDPNGNEKSGAKTDYNAPIQPGPLEIGFDYFFGLPATGDRVPCVYIENHGVVGNDPNDPIKVSYGKPIGDEPTGKEHPELLKVHPSHGHDNTIVAGISRIGYMTGGKAARWIDEDMADVLAGKAVGFMESHRGEPFFLYFCTHDIHVPRVPHPRFAGRSRHGTRGDVIEELDASVGEVLSSLDRLGLADDTLVIFTSDNGGVIDDGYQDGAASDTSGHRPNGALRGFKGQLFEGGHRVPFIARWPGHIPVGQSDQLICHVDLSATCAALLGEKLPDDAAIDSFDILPALLGEAGPVREELVHHTGGFPGGLAIRSGAWKLIAGTPARGQQPERKPLLFNLAEDPTEEHDLAADQPERVAELTERLAAIRKNGRGRTTK